MPDDDAKCQGRQQIDELTPGRAKRQTAKRIARQRCGIAEEEEDETSRPHDIDGHPAVSQVNEERRASHAGRNGRESRKNTSNPGIARTSRIR